MNRLLNDPRRFFDIVARMASHPVNRAVKFGKATEGQNFEMVFDAALDFVTECSSDLITLQEFIQSNEKTDISYRIKTEDSLHRKWDKNLGLSRPLKKVCDDIIGIRIISALKSSELKELTLDGYEEYNIKYVNYYTSPKTVDDGYRGIHLYVRQGSFPIEIQIWSQQDAVLHFYSHEEIYKKLDSEAGRDYSLRLRRWMESVPDSPEEIQQNFIEYMYQFVYSNLGGN